MKKRMIFETGSPEETFELGRKLGTEAVPGEIICLNGDLGTGNKEPSVPDELYHFCFLRIINIKNTSLLLIKRYSESKLLSYSASDSTVVISSTSVSKSVSTIVSESVSSLVSATVVFALSAVVVPVTSFISVASVDWKM